MAIFENIIPLPNRGKQVKTLESHLEPLPKDQVEPRVISEVTLVSPNRGTSDSHLESLPKIQGSDSNSRGGKLQTKSEVLTKLDRLEDSIGFLYSTADKALGYLGLPMPDSVNKKYGLAKESIRLGKDAVHDPEGFLKNTGDRALKSVLTKKRVRKSDRDSGLVSTPEGNLVRLPNIPPNGIGDKTLLINKNIKKQNPNIDFIINEGSNTNPFNISVRLPKSSNENTRTLDYIPNSSKNYGVPGLEPETSTSQPISNSKIKSEFDYYGFKKSFKSYSRSIRNLTLRSQDLWDVSIRPYHYKGIPNLAIPPINDATSRQLTLSSNEFRNSVLPSYVHAEVFNDYVPIIEFDVDYKSQVMKQFDLVHGSLLTIPESMKYDASMNLSIVDTANKRWRRWLKDWSDALYNEKTNIAVPYKNSCLLVDVIQYREDWKLLSKMSYLCTLSNYQQKTVGASTPGVDIIEVELSIVGRLVEYSKQKRLELAYLELS